MELMQVRGVREVDVRIYKRTVWVLIRQPDLEIAVRGGGGARGKKSEGVGENVPVAPL